MTKAQQKREMKNKKIKKVKVWLIVDENTMEVYEIMHKKPKIRKDNECIIIGTEISYSLPIKPKKK